MMATTFNVISLGKNPKIDKKENDGDDAERAHKLVGKSFGGDETPLWAKIQTLSGADDKDVGSNHDDDDDDDHGTSYYDQDNSERNGFHIDGGPEQTFDAVAVYDATLTYADGTTARISAVVFQDTEGNTYLAPELSENADQSALTAQPIVGLELNALLASQTLGLGEDRAGSEFQAPCFTPGARIAVPNGTRPVERLRVGDLVDTADSGPQPVMWVGQRLVRPKGPNWPVRIAAGALGTGLPLRDLVVSPQHRMMLSSPIAQRMTGVASVFLPAKKLLGLPGIAVDRPGVVVRYIHILLPAHEVVFAEAAPTESLFVGPQLLLGLMPQERALLRSAGVSRAQKLARPVPAGHVIRRLIQRHKINRKPLLAHRQARFAGSC